ncbi:EAL domain-containing protein, partial [Rhodoplanes roseus]
MSDAQLAPRSRFGRRRVTPHACVVTERPHLRAFLSETLGELGFVVHACDDGRAVSAATAAAAIDLVVLPVLTGGPAAADRLNRLAAEQSEAALLLLGPQDCPALAEAQQLAEDLGLSVLRPLGTPFRFEQLSARIAHIAPPRATPRAVVDVEEALANHWLELWYQPKIDVATRHIRGAEALLRLRHPQWGIVEPAQFLASGEVPWRAVSALVMMRAMTDWLSFARRGSAVDLAINIPLAVLRDDAFMRFLCREVPDHPLFRGLIVEIGCDEIVADTDTAVAVARQLRFSTIGVSVDDAGPEWRPLPALPDFPFVELKADGAVVNGCSRDSAKRALLRDMVEHAKRVGVPTVAEGVETEDDLITVRELGFDMVQGFVFARAMDSKKFARLLPRFESPALGLPTRR